MSGTPARRRAPATPQSSTSMVASVHAHASSSESVTASSTVTTGESDQAALRAIAQRLHTVLLRQREHEATEHEQSSRVKTETELLLDDARLQCSRVQAHAEDLQSRLALEQTDRAEWCAKAEQAQLRIALLERELEQEKQSCVELEEQLSEASVERGTLEAQIEALQTQLSDQGRRLNSAQQSSNAAAREVVATREMAAREQGAMQAQIDELTEQVNTTAAELTRVKADLKRTAVELKTSEQRLEKEVARARAAALSEQKEKLDAQHTDVIQTIRTSMSVKHEETESEMAVVEQKLAQSEYLVSDLQRTCANLQQTDAHLRAQIRKLQETDRIPELEARVASLTAEAAQWQAAASGVAAKYTGIMQSMRAAYVQKETEFDLLMDAKISLAQDLKTYTMLLELEEERLGIKAPARAQSTTSSTEPLVLTPQPSRSSKKRKTTASLVIHSATTSTSSFASDTVDGTQSLIWSHVDLDGRFARLRNCSTQSVSLAGWYVTNADQSQKFDFPDREIPSGEYCMLWCGTHHEHRELLLQFKHHKAGSDQLRTALDWDPKTLMFWGVDSHRLFNENGDRVLLWNAGQHCADTKPIVPNTLMNSPLKQKAPVSVAQEDMSATDVASSFAAATAAMFMGSGSPSKEPAKGCVMM